MNAKRYVPFTCLFIFWLFIGSCGNDSNEQNSTTSGCGPNTAMILVHDQLLVNGCGCVETAGTIARVQENLQCTVSANTQVVFFYVRPKQNHQIVPIQSGAFTPGPPYLTKSSSPISHAIRFSQTGSYGFMDLFLPDLKGTIIVQ